MRRFAIFIAVLTILTLFWILIVLNFARYFQINDESNLLFNSVRIQFDVIYSLGGIIILGFIFVLFSKKNYRYL